MIIYLYKKNESFGIKGCHVNDMDLESVYDYSRQAAEFVRGDDGLLILEMKTYRYRGHSMLDPARYRTKEELNMYKNNDHLLDVKHIIINNKYCKEYNLKITKKSVKDIVQEVVDFAEKYNIPSEDEFVLLIFAIE